MKVVSKLVCLTTVVLLASNFFCRGEEAAQWGDLINRSTKIEAVLLKETLPNPQLVERTKHVVLNKKQTILVKKFFNTATNYADVVTDCAPQYGARLIFYFDANQNKTNDASKILKLDLCFSCGHMRGELDGKQLAGKYDGFKPMHEPLLNLFKELFPKESLFAPLPF